MISFVFLLMLLVGALLYLNNWQKFGWGVAVVSVLASIMHRGVGARDFMVLAFAAASVWFLLNRTVPATKRVTVLIAPALLLMLPVQVDKGTEIKSDLTPLALCKNAPSAQCWNDAWLPIAQEIGIPAAVQLITAAASRNPQGNESLHCHEILHNLGYLTYDSGYTMRTALAWGTPYTTDCSNGYIHGSLERFLYKQEAQDLESKLDTYCSDWGIDPTTNMSVACVHIVGHAIVKNAEEKGLDWLQALGNCMKVPEDQRDMCWGGGFMQHFISAEHIKTIEKGWPLEKAYSPCDVLPAEWGELAKRYCAMEASTQIYKTVKQDAKMAFDVCATKATETPTILEGCKLGLGKAILAHESMNIGRMIEKCAPAGDECLRSVAWMFANNTNNLESSLLICAPSSSEETRALCAKSVQEGSNSLTGSHN
jgi:hypothetical protein